MSRRASMITYRTEDEAARGVISDAMKKKIEIPKEDHTELGKLCVKVATDLKPFADIYGVDLITRVVLEIIDELSQPNAATNTEQATDGSVQELIKRSDKLLPKTPIQGTTSASGSGGRSSGRRGSGGRGSDGRGRGRRGTDTSSAGGRRGSSRNSNNRV